jgi:broad specificity phosphatase PhoE
VTGRRHLVLVRHGETEKNVAGITQGWTDSALTDRGTQQVQRLAARIARMQPTALYSSPLGRAMSTAQAIADATGLEIRTLEDVREMGYGGWEGRSFLDIRRDDLEIYERWISDPDCPCPEGESHNDVRRRMERAIAAITDERAVVVTHGTALRIAAVTLLGLPMAASRNFAVDNAALNLFIWRPDRWILKHWNDTTHCSDE